MTRMLESLPAFQVSSLFLLRSTYVLMLHFTQMTSRPLISTATQQNGFFSGLSTSPRNLVVDAIVDTPRRTFNRPASARGRIEGARSRNQSSAATTSPQSDTLTVAVPPKEYIEADVSKLSTDILSKRFDSKSAKLRIHVEHSAHLVSTGHSLRHDPEKYKSFYADLEQLVIAELRAFNVQVISNKLSFIGFSGPRPGSFEICLVWDDAESKHLAWYCSIFSKLGTRRFIACCSLPFLRRNAFASGGPS